MKILLNPTVIILLFISLFFSSKLFPQEDLFKKILGMTNSVSSENLIRHIKALENAGGTYSRVNLTPGNDSAAVYIKKSFDAISKLSKVELDTFFISAAASPYNTKPIFNIVATINGTGDSSSCYIIGAHYDCSASRMGSRTWNSQWNTIKAPGADDNATGVAAILEIARILTDSSFNFNSDYSIKLIAFGAEESGPAYPGAGSHPGSNHYVQLAKTRNEKILGMFSIDMIGYNNHYNYTSVVSNSLSQWLGEKLVESNYLYSVGLNMNAAPFPDASYSDHDSFQKAGFRGVLLIENAPPWNDGSFYKANPYYHTSSDTFGTVNVQLVKEVTQLTLATVASLGARLTGVNKNEDPIAANDFYLSQNFPNPFNPETKINYQIPKASFVKLNVFDILGREVAILVNEEQNAGQHSISFNALQTQDGKQISSGIYFYKLSAGNFNQIRKMILMK